MPGQVAHACQRSADSMKKIRRRVNCLIKFGGLSAVTRSWPNLLLRECSIAKTGDYTQDHRFSKQFRLSNLLIRFCMLYGVLECSELSGPKLDQSLKDRSNRLAGFIRLQDSEGRVPTSAVTARKRNKKNPGSCRDFWRDSQIRAITFNLLLRRWLCIPRTAGWAITRSSTDGLNID